MAPDRIFMEIPEVFGLTGGLCAAALAGCDHQPVAHHAALRDVGLSPDDRPRRAMSIDPFLDEAEKRVNCPNGSIRADAVQKSLWRWAIPVGAYDAPRGRVGEEVLAVRASAGALAVDRRAGPVAAVPGASLHWAGAGAMVRLAHLPRP